MEEELFLYLPSMDESDSGCGCIVDLGEPQDALHKLGKMAEAAEWLRNRSLEGVPDLVRSALQELDAPLFDIAYAKPADRSFDAEKTQIVDGASVQRTFGISEGDLLIPGDEGSSMQIAGDGILIAGVPRPQGGWLYAGISISNLQKLAEPFAEEASSPAP